MLSPESVRMSPSASEFLFCQREGQQQMKRGAAVQWKAAQWQQCGGQHMYIKSQEMILCACLFAYD